MSTYIDEQALSLLEALRKRGIPVKMIKFHDRSRGSLVEIHLYTGEIIRLRTEKKWFLSKTSSLSGQIPDTSLVDLNLLDDIAEKLDTDKCPYCNTTLTQPYALALHIYFEHPEHIERILRHGNKE